MKKIHNPIIPGFYPDPSVCRKGDDFYLVCSSFELYPGLPVFHSRDLAHWKLIGHAMSSKNGFDLKQNYLASGVMAPTIRYHDGYFYIINTNFSDKGTYFIKASDPAGPWSNPIWISEIKDLDASLFFDNGRSYVVTTEDADEDNGRGIFLSEIDLSNGKLQGKKKQIWNSALRGAASPEAPHLYFINGYYYLLIAEGGTEHYHSCTVARSKELFAWYESNPANPVLTHRHLGFNYPITNIGHADLVDTPDGGWYAVMLGSRLIEGPHKNLGRETFLCPVTWEKDWPVFAPETGKVENYYPADSSLPWCPEDQDPLDYFDDFSSGELHSSWVLWARPEKKFWSLENGKLSLDCLPDNTVRPIDAVFDAEYLVKKRTECSLIFRRQLEPNFLATTKLTFQPRNKEAAGLIIMQAMNHQFRVEKKIDHGETVLTLVQVTSEIEGRPYLPNFSSHTIEEVLYRMPCDHEREIILGLNVEGQKYQFLYGNEEDNLKPFGPIQDGRVINSEIVGGMVGTMLGVFTTSNGEDSFNSAEFSYFDIQYSTENAS